MAACALAAGIASGHLPESLALGGCGRLASGEETEGKQASGNFEDHFRDSVEAS